MFITGYSDFSIEMPTPLLNADYADGSVQMTAGFRFLSDVSPLFPYINAAAEGAVYYEKPEFIKFRLGDVYCALYPEKGAAACFEDRREALDFMERLIEFLNDLHLRKDSILPNPKRYRPVSLLDIYRLLPGTNCRACDFSTCMAFAGAISLGRATPDRCPGFARPIAESAVYPVCDKEGNRVSTVTLDIDTSKTRQELAVQKARVEELERKLSGYEIRIESKGEIGSKPVEIGLTRRELEVLGLVAQGGTNMEISDLLFISPHTVKSHVINIFNKLGVNDRTQAAVWAARHGLV